MFLKLKRHATKAPLLAFSMLVMVLALNFYSFSTSAEEQTAENPTDLISPNSNLNLNNVPIRSLISAISEITNRNFIIDPIVAGRVSFVSGKAIPESELYNTFLLILQAYNFEAVEVGDNLYRIMPRVNAKKTNTKVVEYPDINRSPEIVTTIITLQNIRANKAFEILRPLIPDESHLAIYEPSNQLIVSASEQTINQIRNLLTSIDSGLENEKTELIELKNSSVNEIMAVLATIAKTDDSSQGTISPDTRTNSLLIRGKERYRNEIKLVIQKLDGPTAKNNAIEIFKLNYLEANETAKVLNELMQTTTKEGNPIANQIGIQANESTNSLIVKGNNVAINTIRDLIKQIDVRKPQVLVEAIIADVSDDFASEIGVQWSGIKEGRYVGSVNFSASSNPISGVISAAAAGRNDLIANNIGSGAVAGVALGNWALLLNALENNTSANVLSRPSIVTLDNQEAEIFVGENVPFIQSSVGGDYPTTTVERVEVGIKLKVKPKINPNQKVTMEIEQEISALSSSAQNTQAVDLITQSRKINTRVSMDDREIIVLGGLSSDQNSQINQKVPLLSDIPILGRLFSYDTQGMKKQSLMIFLRVVILPDNSLQQIEQLYQRSINMPPLDEPPGFEKVIQGIYQPAEATTKPAIPANQLTLPEPYREVSELNGK